MPLIGQNIVPGSVYQTDLTHSAVLVHFSTDSDWGNLRLRYATTAEGSCASGTGSIRPSSYSNGDGHFHPRDRMQIVLSGLQASTQYSVCPEVSNNGDQTGGGSWHGGQAVTFTTLPLPADHPLLPVPPIVHDPPYPDTGAYHKVQIDASCSNRNALIDDALAHDQEYGTVITADPSIECRQRYEPDTNSEGVITFSSSAATAGGTAASSTLYIPNTGGEGQGLIFAAGNYGGLPGSPGGFVSASPQSCTGIITGYVYYKHIVGTDPNRFQLTCNAPFGSTAPNGPAKVMVFADRGYGNSLLVDLYPSSRYWVILRTSTPDNLFPPPETRVSPQWTPKMPKMVHPYIDESIDGNYGAPACNGYSLFSTGRCDGGNPVIISNLWILGWDIHPAVLLDQVTSTDGEKTYDLLGINRTSHDIVLDRDYIHGNGAPGRIFAAIADWTGRDQVIKNSYFDKFDIYQSNYVGLTPVLIDASHFKITPGAHALNGAAKYSQTTDITVTLSGTGSGDMFISASLDGKTLNVALPPGVSGTCDSPCNAFTARLNPEANGEYNHGATAYPRTLGGNPLYWVNPLFNTIPSATGAIGLLDATPDPSLADFSAAPEFAVGGYDVGLRFVSKVNGYLPAIRFYKDARDNLGIHTVTIWDSTGRSIATAATGSETASGWQTATFSSPPAITAGRTYTASYYSSVGVLYADNWFENQNIVNGNLEAFGAYVAGSGGCDTWNSWPKNWAGHTRVGMIACGSIANGSISSIDSAWARGSGIYRVENANGSNAIQSGQGPGPFLFQNNFFSATGNGIHFNEGGQDGFDPHYPHWQRGDFSIIRNTFQVPLDHIAPWLDQHDPQNGADGYTPAYDPGLIAISNGLYYQTRQPLEWKAGGRINVDGNLFTGGFSNTAASIFVALTSVCDEPIHDVSLTNNTFAHGPGILAPMSDTEGGCMQTPPTQRFRFSNNLVYDIRGSYWAPGGPLGAGQGWLFNALPHEDSTITHNTVLLNRGVSSSIATLYDQKAEGLKIENNIFWTYAWGRGIMSDNSGYPSGPHPCQQIARSHNLGGKLYADCMLTNYTFTRNLLFGDSSQADLTASDWWPTSAGNIVLSSPSDPSAAGWQNLGGAFQAGWGTMNGPPATPVARPNFRLQSASPIMSGAMYRANDGSDLGVNMEALERSQSRVGLIGVPNSSITQNAATVVFVAPDNQSCPVDYSYTDASLISIFIRVADSGTHPGPRAVTLMGLSPGQIYSYRVNCQVEQPTGQFVTKR